MNWGLNLKDKIIEASYSEDTEAKGGISRFEELIPEVIEELALGVSWRGERNRKV